ncbi:hypothetical protein KAM342_18520 [Aeromonas caviae]|uniref:Uncharacterized protein n=1 Tax=Aeromonas caviae TaxID=648 RepID=A0AAV4YP73_AERCA|nr:hypothetical protein KAM342_18520 [Aeromonas caviae]GJA42696.1 hypothetical protein KAM343_34920 [Aeromonas caviae]GJA76923.1 hypothetical protein KAM354_21590 [Aeromonas caviae]GJA96475.1 hypothetical protein KAM358_43070 [Aeromonas caviae]
MIRIQEIDARKQQCSCHDDRDEWLCEAKARGADQCEGEYFECDSDIDEDITDMG